MKSTKRIIALVLAVLMAAVLLSGCGSESPAKVEADDYLTNVSYDPTREFYAAYNELFAEYWLAGTGRTVSIAQSHGGSGSQARSVIEGADADVVTLALAHDITLIEEAGLLDSGWINEFESHSAPYTSTIVFLVRAGNEKDIHDWDDLIKDGVEIISPDPKSSGGACWNFLAAWHYADTKFGGDEAQIRDFVTALYENVLVMDSGARGATTTFVENGQGDVLIAWENEALQTLDSYPGEYLMITPSVSIKAEPTVAIVDRNVEETLSEDVAYAYLNYLYSVEAQKLAARYGYRPTNQDVLDGCEDMFDLNVSLCTIDDFGGWDQAYADFFVDDAVFDQIYRG